MKVISFIISVCFFSSLYFTFSMEISNYWDQLYTDSLILSGGDENPTEYLNPDLPGYKTIWLINYSLFLFSMLSLINIRKLRDRHWGLVNLIINALVLIAFLIPGLYTLSELRESYINQPLAGYYTSGPFNIGIRYISFGFVGMMMITSFRYVRQEFLKPVSFNLGKAFDIVFYSSLIWIISSEMISWLDNIKYSQSYKIVLSILWGSCALIMTGIGIWKRKKHLRIAAIVLFGVTLIKLFLYDISHLDTISKTVVFVALGIILLTISFLYNKYREKIFSDNEG